MSKIAKRIKKNLKKSNNLLVIGSGWGILEDILSVYDTVFVVDNEYPGIRHKNLVYKNFKAQLTSLPNISVILIDRDKIDKLNIIAPLITSARPQIAIQGEEVIPRTESGLLYQTHYRATAQHGFFHVWESL